MSDITTLMMAAAAGAVGGEYEIERSLRFNSADSAHATRTFASVGDRKTWTWSAWVKLGAVTGDNTLFAANASATAISFGTYSSALRFLVDGTYGGTRHLRRTTAVYRDPSAWYHIVVALDTTQATDTNRIKAYINGEQVALDVAEVGSWPAQNSEGSINNNIEHCLGERIFTDDFKYNGYMTEVHFVDGQALTPSSFGEYNATTGVWSPIEYTGTYGTNGFYLDFSDNTSTTTLGYDAAGSNDWTLNNFSVTAGAGNDSLVDSPTRYGTDTGAGGEVRGNYATWNLLINGDSAANGNLDVTNDTARSTQALLQFDTYWEITSTGGTTTAGTVSGTGTTNTTTIAGTKTYGFRLTAAGTLDYINITDGGSFTNITTGLTGQQFIYASAASATTGSLNTGQRPFAATAPSGFKALCTQNLPNPTIADGGDYFNTVLYTGTGASQSITGVGFQPDWVWIKERNASADHALYDAVRGVQNQLESNTTTAETTEATGLTAFGTDGFTVGALAQLNTSADTYVAWNWNAGGSNATNTDGTITSTVRANPTAGFSIVTYTGTGSAATVGHGLGAVPRMFIVKNRDQADAWQVYHAANTAAPETDYLVLNTTAATADAADRWDDTLPTSTVFSIGDGVEVNTNTEDYVAYCFAEVPGFSAFGSYTGNGSNTAAPFVYLGFRPAFVLVKNATNGGVSSDWWLFDNKRGVYNLNGSVLYPSLADAEFVNSSIFGMNFFSNGFQLNSNTGPVNQSGNPHIYAAFAENPFKYSLAR
jgi:hypothetical protein